MANMQLQKTRNAATFTKTAIDQKQSLEVVQTMLHGGLSSICYLREIFGDHVYDEQMYEMAEKIHPYADYAAGTLSKDTDSATAPVVNMKTLMRDRSRRVDVLLDWLENGAFPALANRTLRALQVYIHPDPSDRKKVVETYTFRIKYVESSNGQRTLAGLQLAGPRGSEISIGAAITDLQDFLLNAMEFCESLVDLPSDRFMTMELFYLPSAALQTPKGWIASKTDDLFFAEADGWVKQSQQFRGLDSGFHSASLSITSLLPVHKETKKEPKPQRPKFPELKFGKACSKRADIQSSQTESRVAEVAEEIVDEVGTPPNATTPSTVMENDAHSPWGEASQNPNDNRRISSMLEHAYGQPATLQQSETNSRRSTRVVPSSPGAFYSDDTQSSAIPGMKDALNAMMQPEPLTQGDTQTQVLANRPIANTKGAESKRCGDSSLLKRTGHDKATEASRPLLSQRKMKHLADKKGHLRSIAHKLARAGNKKKKSTDLILCQCGSYTEVGDMVSCVYCGTWQHLPCYGFTGENDPRLPTDHVCYQCLLGEKEEVTLNKLGDLAKQRHAMHFTIKDGLKTQRDFASGTGLIATSFVPLQQCLKQEGYIVKARGSHKAGHAAAGKPQFVAVSDGPNHEKMMKSLFDPMTYIGHHFDPPGDDVVPSATLSRQLQASKGRSMPPPATPASQLKKNMQTPSTGLDLRASMTPFETPSRGGRHQTPTRKRKSDQTKDEESPPKRHNHESFAPSRLKSVKTALMLHAGPVTPESYWASG